MSSLASRTLSALAMMAGLAVLLYFNGWVLAVGMLIIAVLAEMEMVNALSKKGSPVAMPVAIAFSILLPVSFFFFSFTGAFTLALVFVCILFVVSIFSKKYDISSVIKGGFCLLYPGLLFVFLYATVFRGDGKTLVDAHTNLFIIIATSGISVATDTLAYLIGSLLGKHKLCPAISPKKSVEGAVAGILGGVIGAVIVMLIFNQEGVNYPLYMAFAVVASAFSQIGDLSASLIKRHFEIKDYSHLLGEHGGIMDRMDSVLFIMPMSYIFFFMISTL